MTTLTQAQFRNHVRFLFNDTVSSNFVERESLQKRPGNIIDGNNQVLKLLNRRIVSISIYDEDQVPLTTPADYSINLLTGLITFVVAPSRPFFADYYWQKLTDSEMDEAISAAAAAGAFNPLAVDSSILDFCGLYALAFCWLAASSKAAEYYTISAAGKQLSKSELFNHYIRLYQSTLDRAMAARTDKKTDRGDRDIPVDGYSSPSYLGPYLS